MTVVWCIYFIVQYYYTRRLRSGVYMGEGEGVKRVSSITRFDVAELENKKFHLPNGFYVL